jgi:hypothetical protein
VIEMRSVILVVLVTVLTGCSPIPSVATSHGPVVSAPAMKTVIPTPNSAKVATVAGTLIREDKDGKRNPYGQATLFLGQVLTDKAGKPFAVAMDEAVATKATTTSSGQFIFTNVAPAEYGLILRTPVGNFKLNKMDGSELLIRAEAGQVVDLGDLLTDIPY